MLIPICDAQRGVVDQGQMTMDQFAKGGLGAAAGEIREELFAGGGAPGWRYGYVWHAL
jgi:hypothetical protein